MLIVEHPDDIEENRGGQDARELWGQPCESQLRTRGNALTSLSDCTASLFSWTMIPNRKMGRLYAGEENGLMMKDKTWEMFQS